MVVLRVPGYSRTQQAEWRDVGVLSVSGHSNLEICPYILYILEIIIYHCNFVYKTYYGWSVFIEQDIW